MRLARLLEKYQLKATFYIAPQDREFLIDDRLNSQEIKKLSSEFEVGAHTMTHPLLPRIDTNTAKQEIITSKKMLEDLIGRRVSSFCYPAGAYEPEHVKMVENAGFKYARTVRRFYRKEPKKVFEAATTLHAYRHWSDVFAILWFVKFNPSKFFRFLFNWDLLAVALFDSIIKTGGVFHMWGHSWEIDANEDWDRLERVFRHIANRVEVEYVTNEELVCKPARNSSS